MQKNRTNVKGNVSESAALNAFSRAGFVVSLPFGNGAPYDLVVDTGKRLLKVQVKTGRLRGGCVLFPAQRIYGHHGTTRHKYFEFETFLKNLSGEVELVGLEPTASTMPLLRSSN